ncbi:MAG: TonB-dependent receptor plug domain-containing protein [Paracoccaceae bacterium]
MKRSALLLLGCLLAPLGAAAQDFDLGTIVITPNRSGTAAGRTGTSVSVVTQSDLKRTGEPSVAAAMAKLPGVSVATEGPFGNLSTLRIRGADGRYLAVYIDGIRVGDPASTETRFDFGSLLSADVGRIEVLRGSQSALYGGSAVGGVISISTPAATEEGTRQTAAAEAGSYGTAALSYGLTQKTGPLELTLGLAHRRTDGLSAAAGGTEADGSEATRLSFGARYAVSDTLTLGGNLFAQRTRFDYDGYDAFFTFGDAANSQVRREEGARVFAEWQAGATAHVFDVTAYDLSRDLNESGALSSFSGRRLTFGWQATTELSDALTLVYGADTMQETATYANLPSGRARTRISGAFAQALWSPTASLDLSGAVRVDRNSSFGTFPTGRLTAAWRPAEGLTVRASAATGFRAPSLDERFGDYSVCCFFVGNPNLTPEESESYELGVDKSFRGGGSVSATLFRLNIDNLIAANATFTSLVNVPGKSVREGLELAATLPLGDRATLTGAYTYTDARRPDGTDLVRVPKHELALTLGGKLGDRLEAAVTLKHAAGRIDNDVNTFARVVMPDYTVMHAQATYDIGNGAEVVIRAENLFDEDYQLVNGYATAGRSLYVGLRADF